MAGLLPPSSSVTGVRCFGRGAHHDAADGAVARVEDVVEALREQRGRLVDRTVTTATAALVEIPGNEVGERGGRRRRDLGRLEDRGVARRERRDQRRKERAGPGSSTER